jgi:hypothetical protein
MPHRSAVRRFAIAIGAVALSCALAGVIGYALRPPSFPTRREAIAHVLDRHGVHYEAIYLERGWPDQINSSAYTSSLRIIVRNLGDVGGRYECRDGDRRCWMAVPKLGIDMEPVPDLTLRSEVPLLDWLTARYDAIRAGRLPELP